MKAQLVLIISIFTLFTSVKCYPQATIGNLESVVKKEPKPVVILVSTEWCKYCQLLKSTTLSDNEIKTLLDSEFHYFEFDAETKEDIIIAGTTYKFKPSGSNNIGIHELAELLASKNGQVSYPTIVFLDDQLNILYQHVGVLEKEELLETLKNLASFKSR